VRLIFELYALALKNARAYPGVLEDPLAYWQKLTAKAAFRPKPDGVEATLLLAATRGLLWTSARREIVPEWNGRWRH